MAAIEVGADGEPKVVQLKALSCTKSPIISVWHKTHTEYAQLVKLESLAAEHRDAMEAWNDYFAN